MPDNAMDLQDRVRRLEAAVRRGQWLAVVATLALLGVVVATPQLRSTVSARTYLLDAGGVNRAALTTAPDGTPSLAFFDAAGRTRLNLSMRDDGSPDITLSDPDGSIRAALLVSETGIPYLFFTDPHGEIRAAFGVPPDGLPSLVLLGDRGAVRYMTP